MSVSLVNDLEAYSAVEIERWAAYSKCLSQEVGRWAAERLESTLAGDVIRPELVYAAFVSEELLGHLLAPETAQKLLNLDFETGRSTYSKIDTRLRADLAQEIQAFLVSAFVSAGVSGHQNDPVDLPAFSGLEGHVAAVPKTAMPATITPRIRRSVECKMRSMWIDSRAIASILHGRPRGLKMA
jgi:hypothetical protein